MDRYTLRTSASHAQYFYNIAGSRPSSDRSAHGRDQVLGMKPVQGALARAASDAVAGNGSLPPPVEGPACSPQSARRGGAGAAGAASGAQGGATKTIQSYFFKPSNGSGMQALAVSYASGETGGGGGEVDLSGVDDEKWDGESVPSQGQHRTISRIGRNGSAGGVNGGNTVGSLQHRFSNAAASAAIDQGVGQGHNRRQDGHSTAGGAGGAGVGGGVRVGEKMETQAAQGHESVEGLLARLRDAEALAKRLRKELDRANLERGGMETMVGGRSHDGRVSCWLSF